jgi:hypothetical protein
VKEKLWSIFCQLKWSNQKFDKMSEGFVKKIWKRSQFAEGNPLHKSFTREPLEENELIIQGLKDSSDWHRDKQVQERKQTGDSPWDRAILIQTEEHIKTLKNAFPETN